MKKITACLLVAFAVLALSAPDAMAQRGRGAPRAGVGNNAFRGAPRAAPAFRGPSAVGLAARAAAPFVGNNAFRGPNPGINRLGNNAANALAFRSPPVVRHGQLNNANVFRGVPQVNHSNNVQFRAVPTASYGTSQVFIQSGQSHCQTNTTAVVDPLTGQVFLLSY